MDHDLFAGMGEAVGLRKSHSHLFQILLNQIIYIYIIYILEIKHLFYLILNLFVRQGVTL